MSEVEPIEVDVSDEPQQDGHDAVPPPAWTVSPEVSD